jgi:hypothetical protein
MRSVSLTSAVTVFLTISGVSAHAGDQAAKFTCFWQEDWKNVGSTCVIDSSTQNYCSYKFNTGSNVSCITVPDGSTSIPMFYMECRFTNASSQLPTSIPGGTFEEMAKAMLGAAGFESGALARGGAEELQVFASFKESANSPEIAARCGP